MIYDKFRVQLLAPGHDFGYDYRSTLEGCIKYVRRIQQETKEKRARQDTSLARHYPIPRARICGKDSTARYPMYVVLGEINTDGGWTPDEGFLESMRKEIAKRHEQIAKFNTTIDKVWCAS